MCEAGILNGDYVVIEHRQTARNGEIVVALIRGEETTLKRIVQEPGRVILTPENSTLEPITLAPEDVEIQGVLVGQMRAYR
jgi:repressor LexA